MSSHSLYWHLATITPHWHGPKMPAPPHHRLIAVAGIEVEHDRENGPTVKDVWAYMAANTHKVLNRLDAAVGEADRIVGLYSRSFGFPTVYANCLATSYSGDHFVSNVLGDLVPAVDLADDLCRLVAPTQERMTFDEILDFLQLPFRLPLDIAAAWDSETPKVKRKIPMRLIIDCYLVALVEARMQYVVGDWDYDYYDRFTDAVGEAVAAKVPKAFEKMQQLSNPDQPTADDDPAEQEASDE